MVRGREKWCSGEVTMHCKLFLNSKVVLFGFDVKIREVRLGADDDSVRTRLIEGSNTSNSSISDNKGNARGRKN